MPEQPTTNPASGDTHSTVAGGWLFDPTLNTLAALVDDLEKIRIATANRHNQLTRTGLDKDGHQRGYGLPDDHPAVRNVATVLAGLKINEKTAVSALERQMKNHPLGPWVAAQHGIGQKTVARLLAAVGDPYWNTLHDRPRTVSELWAYCGYKPGQKRRKGQRANWSNEAKKRAYLIAEFTVLQLSDECKNTTDEGPPYRHHDGCGCSPWRVLWDQRRFHTLGRWHNEECARCGPKGHPAQPGTPWSQSHAKTDATRIVAKEFLKELWRESRRLYDEAPPM